MLILKQPANAPHYTIFFAVSYCSSFPAYTSIKPSQSRRQLLADIRPGTTVPDCSGRVAAGMSYDHAEYFDQVDEQQIADLIAINVVATTKVHLLERRTPCKPCRAV